MLISINILNIGEIKIMTDNLYKVLKYFTDSGFPIYKNESGDKYITVMLVRRGKDHPDLPSANYTFKSYFIDSLESLEHMYNEIKQCCDMFRLRAYISVNIKSKEKLTKSVAYAFSLNILNNEYKKPWNVIYHANGKNSSIGDSVWIVDIDDCNDSDNEYINKIIELINMCNSKFNNNFITTIPTKSGIHLLTHPFNLQQFNDFFKKEFPETDIPEVKKDHLTLLYENI